MQIVDVYSRQGCHLCEVLLEQLLELVDGMATVAVHDVDTCDVWREKYGLDVPVVEYRGTLLCAHRLDRDAVRQALAGKA